MYNSPNCTIIFLSCQNERGNTFSCVTPPRWERAAFFHSRAWTWRIHSCQFSSMLFVLRVAQFIGTECAVRKWQIAQNMLQNMLLHCQFPAQSWCFRAAVKMGWDSLICLLCSSSVFIGSFYVVVLFFSSFRSRGCFQRASFLRAVVGCTHQHLWAARCKNRLGLSIQGHCKCSLMIVVEREETITPQL